MSRIMRVFSLLIVSARITVRSLHEMESAGVFLVRILIVPLSTGFLYLGIATGAGAASPNPGDVIAAGASVGAVMASMSASTLITMDKYEGTLLHLLLASSGKAVIWAGRISVLVGLGFITSCLVTAFGLLIVRPHMTLQTLLFIVVVLGFSSFGGVGVGLVLGAVGLGLRDPLLLSNIAEFTFPLVCGVVAPIGVLPEAVQWLSWGFPLTPAIQAGRTLTDLSANLDFETLLAISASSSLVWTVVGYFAWRVFERQVQIKGTIEIVPI